MGGGGRKWSGAVLDYTTRGRGGLPGAELKYREVIWPGVELHYTSKKGYTQKMNSRGSGMEGSILGDEL